MADRPTRVLLVEDSQQDADCVEELLSQSEDVPFVVVRAGSLTEALEQLMRCDVDVILADLCLPDGNGLESFTSIQSHAPTLPVVLLTGVDSDALALIAVRSGAQDYLTKTNLTSEALVRALRYAIMRRKSAGRPEVETRVATARVLGFIGSKGGVGTTTLACHVARALHTRAGEPVLLADLDIHGGLVGFSMNIHTPHSILDACNNFLRLDLTYFKALVTNAEGLDVIAAPGPAGALIAERVRYVLRFARAHYRWIVADLGRFSPFSAALLPLVRSVRGDHLRSAGPVRGETRRGADGGFGVRDRPRQAAVNQASRHGLFTSADMEQAIGLPIFAAVSNDDRELSKARTNGTLAGETGDFGRQIAAIAARVEAAGEKACTASALPRGGEGD